MQTGSGSPPRSTQRPRHGRARAADTCRGAVTAEFAVALPAVLLLLALLLAGSAAGVTQLRLEEAARAGARALARGEDAAAVDVIVRRLAGASAASAVASDGEWVSVTVSGQGSGRRRLAPSLDPLGPRLDPGRNVRAISRGPGPSGLGAISCRVWPHEPRRHPQRIPAPGTRRPAGLAEPPEPRNAPRGARRRNRPGAGAGAAGHPRRGPGRAAGPVGRDGVPGGGRRRSGGPRRGGCCPGNRTGRAVRRRRRTSPAGTGPGS